MVSLFNRPEQPPQEAACDILLSKIDIDPLNGRGSDEDENIRELADTIRQDGVAQPIVVRRSVDRFHLIAGERRVRACRSLGMTTIPAIIRTLSDAEFRVVRFVENGQRADLNNMATARQLEAIGRDVGGTHQAIADRVGKSRTWVVGMLGFLKLSPQAQYLVEKRRIQSLENARAFDLLGSRHKQHQADVYSRLMSGETFSSSMLKPPKAAKAPTSESTDKAPPKGESARETKPRSQSFRLSGEHAARYLLELVTDSDASGLSSADVADALASWSPPVSRPDICAGGDRHDSEPST